MCGIAGICNDKQNSIKDIQAMNVAMLRRGPDDGDYWYDEQSDVVLGHRRLSIVDLSANGRQPMQSLSERYVIIYNGEIYNYRELQDTMQKEGIVLNLRGTSDTEILLTAIENWGIEKTLTNCKGMFAFAVYDRKEKELILARDRMGEKPLYYGMTEGRFVFASDLNSVKAISGFKRDINQGALQPYMIHGYIPAPYTIYENMYKLLPGHYLRIQAPFTKWQEFCYWDMKMTARMGQENLFSGSLEEATDELESKLLNAVKGQMIADVPLGAFLSGGIDSTLTVSLMQSLSRQKIKTFTIGFKENGFDEAIYAKETADYLGTEHTEMYVGFDDVMELLPQLPVAFSEPFADSSQLPTMLVSKMTRNHVTVALSGDGGDEFFCGYNTYKEIQNGLRIMEQKLGFLPNGLRTTLGRTCQKISGNGLDGFSGRYTRLMKKTGRVLTLHEPEDLYRAIAVDDYRIPYLTKSNEQIATPMNCYENGYLKGAEPNLMLMDMLQYLPEDILTKVDRSGMFYSLETRIPILDRDVMEFAWRLPQEYKYHNGITKRVLKEVLYRHVPQEMTNRPKKGFSVPVGEWLQKGKMHDWAMDILSSAFETASPYMDTVLFRSMFDEFLNTGVYNSVLWHGLILEQWLLEEKKA